MALNALVLNSCTLKKNSFVARISLFQVSYSCKHFFCISTYIDDSWIRFNTQLFLLYIKKNHFHSKLLFTYLITPPFSACTDINYIEHLCWTYARISRLSTQSSPQVNYKAIHWTVFALWLRVVSMQNLLALCLRAVWLFIVTLVIEIQSLKGHSNI